jgi:outer membrane protein assembly factor BamB
MPGWGFAGSPLVHQELLLLNVGAAGMALYAKTGKVVWTSENEEAGYSSPLPFRQGDEWFAAVSSGETYSAVNIRTGKPLWQARWITRYGLNAVDPIIYDGHVFLSAGYNKGATLLKPGDGEPTVVWKNKNLRNQLNCSVLLDGFLYGIDGDTNTKATLRCVEWKSGEVRWTQDGVGAGSLMAADGKLIVLSESGELLIVPPTADGFRPTARAKVVDAKCWTVPVLTNGRIFCRTARGDLVCLDVRATK